MTKLGSFCTVHSLSYATWLPKCCDILWHLIGHFLSLYLICECVYKIINGQRNLEGIMSHFVISTLVPMVLHCSMVEHQQALWWPSADSRLAPSQWETSLQSNGVSHWLVANLESALWPKPVSFWSTGLALEGSKQKCLHLLNIHLTTTGWTTGPRLNIKTT